MTLLDALLFWKPPHHMGEGSSLLSPLDQRERASAPSSRPGERLQTGVIVIMRSGLTGGLVYLVGDPCRVRILLDTGVPRGAIWTVREIQDALGVPAAGRRLEALAARFLDADVVGRE